MNIKMKTPGKYFLQMFGFSYLFLLKINFKSYKLLSSCGRFVFVYDRELMLSLSDNNQTDIIEAFNSTFRYSDDLLYIDNPYFEQMVGQIYPTDL